MIFSNYPSSHQLFSNSNKKVIGKYKDECAGDPIMEFVGLRPKVYSILTEKDNKKKLRWFTNVLDAKNPLFTNIIFYTIRGNMMILLTLVEFV